MSIDYPISSRVEQDLGTDELYIARTKYRDALVAMHDNPPGGDPHYEAFATAAIEHLDDPLDATWNSHINLMLNNRRDRLPDYQVQLTRIAAEYVIKNFIDDRYPGKHGTEVSQWHAWLDKILSNSLPSAIFSELSLTRENQASDQNRYAGPKLAIQSDIEHVLPEKSSTFSWVDVGCGTGLGVAQLGENLPFNNVRVIGKNYVQSLMGWFLEAPLPIKLSIGMDKFPTIDPLWAEACITYAKDANNQRKAAERQIIYHLKDKFEFLYGDVTKGETEAGVLAARSRVPNGKYDVAVAVNSMYEISVDQRIEAFRTLESLATKLVVVQEVAHINPRNREQLLIEPDIYQGAKEGRYALFSKRPDKPWQRLAAWPGGFQEYRLKPTKTLIDKLIRQIQSNHQAA